MTALEARTEPTERRVRVRDRFTPMVLVIIAGAIARVVLVPISFGQDFVVWRLVSSALLHGRNFYAHPPAHLPGGPYGYLPLFAYVELPFRLLSNVTPVSFTILGKLPVLAGDVGVAWGIAAWCRRSGLSYRTEVLAVALWWLNPLVLYNGAFYGRFDSLCLAFLLAALLAGPPVPRGEGRRSRSPIYFGLGIAAKTFPAFVLPWFIRNGRERARFFWTTVLTTVLVSLPLIVLSPGDVVKSVLLYDTNKTPTNMSWLLPLSQMWGKDMTRAIGTFVLLGFFVSLIVLTKLELPEYCCAAFCAFIVFSKVVNEQYLVWVIPFLAVLYVTTRKRQHLWMLGLYTAIGSLLNPFVHPIGRQGTMPTEWVNVLLALSTAAYLIWLMADRRRTLAGEPVVVIDRYLDAPEIVEPAARGIDGWRDMGDTRETTPS
ncbi:MAG TPA: glycosyltransferase 87 family protein [Acidimicrobiia bacterium]|jgi:hypothetical protein